MVTVEKSEKIGDTIVFTLTGNIEKVRNGFEFSYDGKKYCVKSVAMLCNKSSVRSARIDVTAELIGFEEK